MLFQVLFSLLASSFSISYVSRERERGGEEETLVRKFSTHGDDSWKLLEDLVERSKGQCSNCRVSGFETLIGTIRTSRPCRDAQTREIRAKDGNPSDRDSMDESSEKIARITADAR